MLDIDMDDEKTRQRELARDVKIIIKREKEFAREEGYKMGVQVARKEWLKNVAKKLKEKGFSVEEIEEITKLQKEEIIDLLKK